MRIYTCCCGAFQETLRFLHRHGIEPAIGEDYVEFTVPVSWSRKRRLKFFKALRQVVPHPRG